MSDPRSITPSQLTVKEVYELSAGKKPEYGIDGYYCAKTYNYITKEIKISTAKTKSMYYEVDKRAKDPDPTKYAESPEQNLKRYWLNSNGKFTKGKRKNMVDDITQLTKHVPGPGAYFKDPKSQTPASGRFFKSDKINFIDSAQFLAEETPDCGKYNPKDELVYPKARVCKMGKPTPEKTKPKEKVGPGSYHDGISNAHSRSFTVSKSKRPNSITENAELTKFVPGIGAYTPDKNIVMKKARATIFTPSKFQRFADIEAKNKAWVPGPGSYNICPQVKR